MGAVFRHEGAKVAIVIGQQGLVAERVEKLLHALPAVSSTTGTRAAHLAPELGAVALFEKGREASHGGFLVSLHVDLHEADARRIEVARWDPLVEATELDLDLRRVARGFGFSLHAHERARARIALRAHEEARLARVIAQGQAFHPAVKRGVPCEEGVVARFGLEKQRLETAVSSVEAAETEVGTHVDEEASGGDFQARNMASQGRTSLASQEVVEEGGQEAFVGVVQVDEEGTLGKLDLGRTAIRPDQKVRNGQAAIPSSPLHVEAEGKACRNASNPIPKGPSPE